MPLSHISKLYAVEDAKIGKMLTDESGGSATYDTLIDVPGIKTVELGFNINSQELRGDNGQMESDSTLVAVDVTFDHAKVNLDVLAIMIGGTVTDSGTTPNMKATYSRLSTDAFNYFKIEAKTPTNGVDTVGGDAHFVIYKCKVTSYSLGLAEENYRTFSGSARGVYRTSDVKLWDLVLNETTAAIA